MASLSFLNAGCSSSSSYLQKLASQYGADISQVPPSELKRAEELLGPSCDISRLQGSSDLSDLFPNLGDTLNDIANDQLPAVFEGELSIDYPPEGKFLRSGVRLEGACVTGLTVVVEGSAPLQSFQMACENGRYLGSLNFSQSTLEGDKTLIVRQTNPRGASKTVSKTLKHYEFNRYVAVANRGAKRISLFVARADDGRLKEVAVSDVLAVTPERIFAGPVGKAFYVTNQSTSLLKLSVDPYVASMGPIEPTAADDVNEPEEAGTVPSQVVFSDNGSYAYVMRRAPSDGVDVLTAYTVNQETGLLTVATADEGAGLFNRLRFTTGDSNLRAREIEMTLGSEGAVTSIQGSAGFVVVGFAATGQISGGSLVSGPLVGGDEALAILNRSIDRIYYLTNTGGNINYSILMDPADPFTLQADFNLFEFSFDYSMKSLFTSNGRFMYSSYKGQGNISRHFASDSLSFADDFIPEVGAIGNYELAMDQLSKNIFAVNPTLNKVFSIAMGMAGTLSTVSSLETSAGPSGVAAITLP